MPAVLTTLVAAPGPWAPRAFSPAFTAVGDAADGILPFGWDVAGLQQWTLIYLGISSLAFVLVWLVGYLRR